MMGDYSTITKDIQPASWCVHYVRAGSRAEHVRVDQLGQHRNAAGDVVMIGGEPARVTAHHGVVPKMSLPEMVARLQLIDAPGSVRGAQAKALRASTTFSEAS